MNARSMRVSIICILFLVGTVVASCTCPSGTYQAPGALWEISTIGGTVTGTIPALYECGDNFVVTGTSDGTNITFHTENTNAGTFCCSPVDYVATANGDCTELVGTFTFPPDSNCYPGGGNITWSKISSSTQ